MRKDNGSLLTSIFRKSTFTGKATNFFSHIFYNYKLSSINTLINRAYVLTSNHSLVREEITFLRNYFLSNSYPRTLFNNVLENYLSKKCDYQPTYQTAPKLKLFFCLPYLGHQSNFLSKELRELIMEFFPQLNPNFYYRCDRKIGSFFNLKDRPDVFMRSNVIYTYKCDCSQSYIGSTSVQLFVRVSQHRGVSFRTGQMLTRPNSSSIRDHCESHNHRFKSQNFSILDYHSNTYSLRQLESLFIHSYKPELNECNFAVPLNIVI